MIRTDLALEAKELYHEDAGEVTEINGVKATTEDFGDYSVTTVRILNENGEKALNKAIGNYITIEMPKFREYGHAFYEVISELLKKEIELLLPKKDNPSVLVIGLGNKNITPDALGPYVTEKLIVTRHIFELMPDKVGVFGSVSAVDTGVVGTTGIETLEIVKSVAERIKPDVIIAIDALAARNSDRVATTIQISDTGIAPGSGIGNNRKQIDKSSTGVPVIGIGVPTVIDALTVAYDASDKQTDYDTFKKKADKITNLLVTPKDIDMLVRQLANIISSSINIAFHKIELADIDSYIG